MKEKISLEDLSSKSPKVKYDCARKLLITAENNPISLYSDFDYFATLINSENRIIKWTAIDIIGHISRVDKGNKIDKMIGKLFNLLDSGELITANHAISALSNIALARPQYQNKITDELLKVEYYNYDTDECRNIAIGKVILALELYFGNLLGNKRVIEFIKRQTTNARSATSKKAEHLLKKLSKIDSKTCQ
jgi:hypothetical protein